MSPGQLVAEPNPVAGGLGLHASIEGRIEEVTDRHIVIRRRAGFPGRAPRTWYVAQLGDDSVRVPLTAPYGPWTQRALVAQGSVDVSPDEVECRWIRTLAQLDLARLGADRERGQVPADGAAALQRSLDDLVRGRIPARFRLDRFAPAEALERNVREVVTNRALDVLGWDRGRFTDSRPTHFSYLARYGSGDEGRSLLAAGALAIAAACSDVVPPTIAAPEPWRVAYENLGVLYGQEEDAMLLAAAGRIVGRPVALRPPVHLGKDLAEWCDAAEHLIAACCAAREVRGSALEGHLGSKLWMARRLGDAAQAVRALLEVAMIFERIAASGGVGQ